MEERYALSFLRFVWRFRRGIWTGLVGGWSGMLGYWKLFTTGLSQLDNGALFIFWMLVTISVVVILAAAVVLIRGYPDMYEGYKNRDHLHRACGSIENELLRADKTIDICWENASVATGTNIFSNPQTRDKLRRVILLGTENVESSGISAIRTFRGERLDRTIDAITEANRNGAHIELRYMTGNIHLPNMVIVDADDFCKAWLRLELSSPLILENSRPSIVINGGNWIDCILGKRKAGPFKELVDLYDEVFPLLAKERPSY